VRKLILCVSSFDSAVLDVKITTHCSLFWIQIFCKNYPRLFYCNCRV